MLYRGTASVKNLGGIYLACVRGSKEEAIVADRIEQEGE